MGWCWRSVTRVCNVAIIQDSSKVRAGEWLMEQDREVGSLVMTRCGGQRWISKRSGV